MGTKDSGILQKDVNVVVSKAPVLSPIFESVEVGTSLREIFNSYTGLSEQHTKIYVNGDECSDWNYKTVESDYVSVCQVPKGGNDAWMYAAAVVFPVAIPFLIVYAGYKLYKTLDQPETEQGEKQKRISGARNQATPYEPIPFILGTRRVTPVYAAQPYTYWQGDEQHLKMLLCVGYGPLSISDIKIGDTPISQFDGARWKVLDWYTTKSTSGIRSIWNKDIQQDAINQELGKTNYISRSAPAGTSKIRFEMVYPQGLWRTDDGEVGHSIGGFQFRYYVPGRGWYSVARVRSGGGGYADQSVKKSNGNYYIVRSDGSSGAGDDLDENITAYVDREENGYIWVRDGSAGNGRYYYVNTISFWEATRDQLVKNWSFSPIDPITGASLNGDVAFEVKRNGWDYDPDGAGFSTTLQLNTITYELGGGSLPDSYFGIDPSVNRYPVIIALDVRATEQLSGVIENLSCKATMCTPNTSLLNNWKDYSIHSSWTTWDSGNPAHAYKWVLQGPFNGAVVSNDKIDNQALVEWNNECNTRGWKTNEIVNYGVTLKQLLSNIAFTGRAFFSMRDGKFSVIENKSKPSPVQVFTNKNSSGLRSRREFDLVTDGIKYTFANGDYQDQEDEGIYGDPDKFFNSDTGRPKPGANVTGRYDELEVWGTTSPFLARQHARFAYFEKELRREVYQIDTDIESLVARRGDKVLLAHEIIDVGLGQGFIKEINGGQFRIDETINLTAGQSYTLTVRSVDAGAKFTNISATYDGDGWWTGFLPSSASIGDLVAYGESGTQTLECLVTEITYSDNYNASLTLVNYASDLYSVDFGYLPEYESNLTPERPRDITPLAPDISVNYGDFSYQSNAITVNVAQKAGDRSKLSRFSLQYRYNPPEIEDGEEIVIEGDWQDGGVSPANDGTFRVPVSNEQGNVINVRAKAVNEAGVHSPYSEIKDIVLQTDPAADVEDFTITEKVDEPKTPDARWSTLTIEIKPPTPTGGYLYAIAEYRQPGQPEWFNIGNINATGANTVDVQVYADGRQYEIRVRSVSIYGVQNKNGLSKIFTTTNTADPEYTEDNPFEELPAPDVRGLELFDQGNDTEFTGKDAKFTWRKSTLNDWVEIGYEGLKGASASTLDQYFRDYEVEITANDEVVRTENVVDNFYTYTYEKNAEDYERRYGVPGAYREFRISVVMRTRQNQESPKPAVIDVNNPAPNLPSGIELVAGFRTVSLKYNRPTDLDFSGVEVWVGTTSGFDVNDDTLVYDGPDTEVVVNGLETNTTYYVILRPYDAFGKVDIFSTELSATTLKIETGDLDTTPPDKVTGVALSTAVYDDRLQSTSYIDVVWDAVSNVDIANYTLDINGESQYTVAGTSFRFVDAVPGNTYTFQVRANSFASVEGTWSDIESITAAVSSVQPATITGASATGGLDKVVVEWTNPASDNFYTVNVHRGATAGFTPSAANKIGSAGGRQGSKQKYIDAAVVNGTTYYYKLQPETLGGVLGGIVSTGAVTPFEISSGNIQNYMENAAISNAYISNLDAAKITTGELDADRIGANTITANKLDVTQLSAITADLGTVTAGTIQTAASGDRVVLSTLNGIESFVGSTQTLHIKPDGTGYIGASQDISWDGSGNVSISGVLGAGSIFTNGQITATNGNVEVTVGPKDFGVDGVYLLSGTDNAGDLVFGIDELGNAYFRGDITGASGTFSGSLNVNNKFIVDASGNVDSSGTFRFGGSTSDYIEFDGTNLVIDTPELTVDGAGNAEFSGELQSATGVFGNKASGKYIEFDGTDLIIGPESTIGNNDDITVTVGSTGDYATINEALEALSRTVPAYKVGGFTATILLQSSYVEKEGIEIYGIDLSWIKIRKPTGPLDYDCSAVGSRSYVVRARQGARAPLLDFDLRIIDPAGGSMSGILYASENSYIEVVKRNLSFDNRINYDCNFNVGGVAILADVSSTIVADLVRVENHTGTYGIGAYNFSKVNFFNGQLVMDNAGGVLTDYGGMVECTLLECTAKMQCLASFRGGNINCLGGTLSSSTFVEGYVSEGSIINMNGTAGSTNVARNTLTADGIIYG